MKKLFILFSFLSISSFAQNSFFIDKKGNKTLMRDDAFEVILIDKRIMYVLPGKTWEKYVKFDDLDYAVVGPSVLKSFKLNKKNKSSVYFIYAENADKKLIGLSVTVTTTHGTLSTSHTTYELYVVDNNDMVLDEVILESGSTKGRIADRTKVEPMIKKHFSDCSKLIQKLGNYTVYDEKNESIFGFFYDTSYLNCKQ